MHSACIPVCFCLASATFRWLSQPGSGHSLELWLRCWILNHRNHATNITCLRIFCRTPRNAPRMLSPALYASLPCALRFSNPESSLAPLSHCEDVTICASAHTMIFHIIMFLFRWLMCRPKKPWRSDTGNIGTRNRSFSSSYTHLMTAAEARKCRLIGQLSAPSGLGCEALVIFAGCAKKKPPPGTRKFYMKFPSLAIRFPAGFLIWNSPSDCTCVSVSWLWNAPWCLEIYHLGWNHIQHAPACGLAAVAIDITCVFWWMTPTTRENHPLHLLNWIHE